MPKVTNRNLAGTEIELEQFNLSRHQCDILTRKIL